MPPQLESTIFCDDIREEAGNKVTLVGVYGKHLFIPRDAKFPSALRQLCLFMRWSGIRGGEKITFALDYNGEEVFKPDEPTAVRAPKVEDDYSQTSLYLAPFPMKGFGAYRFRIFLDGQVVGESTLDIGPQPEASAGGVN